RADAAGARVHADRGVPLTGERRWPPSGADGAVPLTVLRPARGRTFSVPALFRPGLFRCLRFSVPALFGACAFPCLRLSVPTLFRAGAFPCRSGRRTPTSFLVPEKRGRCIVFGSDFEERLGRAAGGRVREALLPRAAAVLD